MKKIKSLVFVSNYFNHHQRYLSDEFSKRLKDGYHFIATMPMEAERQALGWEKIDVNYVVYSYESQEEYQKSIDLINNADVVVFGSAPHEMVNKRIQENKLTFRYSERITRKLKDVIKYPYRLLTYRRRYPQNKNLFLLCSSAFTSADYSKYGLFKNKAYKFAYFTQAVKYENLEEVLSSKDTKQILWCGRFLKLKHLDHAVKALNMLKKDGYDCKLTVIGGGKEEENIHKLIAKLGLEDMIEFKGVLPSTQVRQQMEKAGIFIFTSDFNEGWGAVLNEAMNSACAVVSSHAIGATNYLVKHGENGFVYKNGNVKDLYLKIKCLLDNEQKQKAFAEKAYKTIVEQWSPEIAATRVLELCESILNKQNTDLYQDGPCSRAGLVKNNWFSQKKNGAK